MSISVSVVIPTNRPIGRGLNNTLSYLSQHEMMPEVFIVHTGQKSIPGGGVTLECGSLQRVHEMAESIPGLLAGRHFAARKATGAVLIYLDDDVQLSEGWLEAITEPFKDPLVHLVGCRYLPDYETEPPVWLERLWTEDSHGRHLADLSLLDFGRETIEIDPVFIWGLCYGIRRGTLDRLGGFHPDGYPWELRRFRGDGETGPSMEARRLKLKAIYQGEAIVYHHVPVSRMTPDYFERRAYLQGISDSYTQVRNRGEAVPYKSSWKEPFRHVYSSWLKTCNCTNLRSVRSSAADGYRAGYSFHQTEVHRDPTLLEWVLRKDYWDYRLPDGWDTNPDTSRKP